MTSFIKHKAISCIDKDKCIFFLDLSSASNEEDFLTIISQYNDFLKDSSDEKKKIDFLINGKVNVSYNQNIQNALFKNMDLSQIKNIAIYDSKGSKKLLNKAFGFEGKKRKLSYFADQKKALAWLSK